MNWGPKVFLGVIASDKPFSMNYLIQPNTIEVWGIDPTNSVVIPQSFNLLKLVYFL